MALSELEKVVVTALLLTTIPFFTIITLLSVCLFRLRRRIRKLQTRLSNLEKDRRPHPFALSQRPHSSAFERAICRDSIFSSPTSTMHNKLRSVASSPSLQTYQKERSQSTASAQSPIAIQDEMDSDKIVVTTHPSTPALLRRATSPTMTSGSATLTCSSTTFSQSRALRASQLLESAIEAMDRIEVDESAQDDDLQLKQYSTRKPTYSETSSLITDAPTKSRADSYVSEEHKKEFEKLKSVRFSELDRLVKAKGIVTSSRDTLTEKEVDKGEVEGSKPVEGEVKIRIQRKPSEGVPVELGDEGALRIDSQASWYYDDGV